MPLLRSWLAAANDPAGPFPLNNLPYGVFSVGDGPRRCGVAIGDRVLDATTLPCLLLGGDPTGEPSETYAEWGRALQCPSAAGLVVGRALLYPPDDDVAKAVDTAAGLVHGAAS